jgi:hypothetical protein
VTDNFDAYRMEAIAHQRDRRNQGLIFLNYWTLIVLMTLIESAPE